MSVTVEESGMAFGPYNESDVFLIESCETYKRIHEGVKVAEFVLLKRAEPTALLYIVEAKKSSPQPITMPQFDEFIHDIQDKMSNSLGLCLACILGRHVPPESALPEKFKAVDLSKSAFRFVLVIRGHKEEWLPPLLDELRQSLRPTVKTWGLAPSAVAAINDQMAMEEGLVGRVT